MKIFSLLLVISSLLFLGCENTSNDIKKGDSDSIESVDLDNDQHNELDMVVNNENDKQEFDEEMSETLDSSLEVDESEFLIDGDYSEQDFEIEIELEPEFSNDNDIVSEYDEVSDYAHESTESDIEKRQICKEACEKIYFCDSIDQGGTGKLNENWVLSCKKTCDEADDINDTISKCILRSSCEKIKDCNNSKK